MSLLFNMKLVLTLNTKEFPGAVFKYESIIFPQGSTFKLRSHLYLKDLFTDVIVNGVCNEYKLLDTEGASIITVLFSI